MLIGTFSPRLDDKGRLVLPAKFWGEFQDGVVITRGQDGCLYLYSQREFEQLYDRMREQLPKLGKRGRDFIRTMLGGAAQEVPDAQRRITIPVAQREYAHLGRELTIIGVGHRAELWDAAVWNERQAEAELEYSEIDEEVIAELF